jgi:hypothetical protein
MLVFFNKLVMMRVSVPMYVNVANFCFCGVSGVLLLLFLLLLLFNMLNDIPVSMCQPEWSVKTNAVNSGVCDQDLKAI